jgi:hypothetical protein
MLAPRGEPSCLVVVVPGVSKDFQNINLLMVSRWDIPGTDIRVIVSMKIEGGAEEGAGVQFQARALGGHLYNHASIVHIELMTRVLVRVVSSQVHRISKSRKGIVIVNKRLSLIISTLSISGTDIDVIMLVDLLWSQWL